jgi:hypothetical protein
MGLESKVKTLKQNKKVSRTNAQNSPERLIQINPETDEIIVKSAEKVDLDNDDKHLDNIVSLDKNVDPSTLPILFLDVNLGKDKVSRIVVYDGDDPKEVTEKFAQLHGID